MKSLIIFNDLKITQTIIRILSGVHIELWMLYAEVCQEAFSREFTDSIRVIAGEIYQSIISILIMKLEHTHLIRLASDLPTCSLVVYLLSAFAYTHTHVALSMHE